MHKARCMISRRFFRKRNARNMSLNRTDIEKIAHLARLALSESEVPAYAESLSRIIGLVGELDHAATSGVAPMSHPLPGLAQRLRVDEITETQSIADSRELYQRNAPRVSAGLYLVPKVIE